MQSLYADDSGSKEFSKNYHLQKIFRAFHWKTELLDKILVTFSLIFCVFIINICMDLFFLLHSFVNFNF